MPVQDFALDSAGRHVNVFWNGENWENLTILIDHATIGIIPNKEELVKGREFTLPDDAVLKVQVVDDVLRVFRNGQRLSSEIAVSDYASSSARAYSNVASTGAKVLVGLGSGATFLIRFVNLVIGSLTLRSIDTYMDSASLLKGIATIVIVLGVIFLALGVGVALRSKVSLSIAVGFYVLDAVLDLLTGNLLAVGIHLVLLIFMIRGFGGIQEIRDAERRTTYRSSSQRNMLESNNNPIWN